MKSAINLIRRREKEWLLEKDKNYNFKIIKSIYLSFVFYNSYPRKKTKKKNGSHIVSLIFNERRILIDLSFLDMIRKIDQIVFPV